MAIKIEQLRRSKTTK